MPPHRLSAGRAVLEVDPEDGGRWTSLVVDGLELLSGADVEAVPPGVRHGCFVMAPLAGRTGYGVLDFRGCTWQLPVDAPPHALHGTVYDVPWIVVQSEQDAVRASLALEARLGHPWPFAGTVRQELVLSADGLSARLLLRADEAMPVVLGYHPWFARRLARGGDLRLDFAPVQQYVRGDDGLPTGELVEPRPGPYDDCFRGTTAPPRLVWPDALDVVLTSSADHWVLFDERPDVLCLEPQTGPPDAVALSLADVVPGGGQLALDVDLRWST